MDDTGDVVVELAAEGTDTVRSILGYALGANLENLTLQGNAAIDGTGNALNNAITGNAAANSLTGGEGNDTLSGGAGDDTYVFGRGHGSDFLRENDVSAGNADVARFLEGIGTDQIWLRHVSNNLEVSLIGTADKLTIANWYLGSQYRIEQFRTADNMMLLDSQVENLVQAMAAFAPPAAGQTPLPQNYQDVLAPVIAANWQ